MSKAEEMIRKLLQPGERLVWWERPRLKYVRSPVVTGKGFVVALLCYAPAIVVLVVIISLAKGYALQGAIELSFILWAVFIGLHYMTGLSQGNTAAVKILPKYWRHTRYVITDRRVMQIVKVPGKEAVVLEYLPHEIEPSVGLIRSGGSGVVTFGTSRRCEVGRYRRSVMLPGSFFGVARVQEVVELLRELKGGDEGALQESAANTSR